jgi:hypothetical protein
MDGRKEYRVATKRPPALIALIVVLFIQAVSALGGGAALIVSPKGGIIKMPLSHLEGSPFHDFLIPGIILFVVLGVGPLVAAVVLLKRPQSPALERINPFHEYWGWTLSGVVGVGLLIWIGVEVAFVPYSNLQTTYAAVGALIVVLTLMPSVRAYYRR